MAKLIGSSGNDLITGGKYNDVLNGLAGADTMVGGGGNDTYFVDSAGDKLSEKLGEGTDRVVSSIALSNAFANIENYDFSKSASPVNFTGNDLDNVIVGTAGTDTLTGGAGNDTYYLSSAQDVVVETALPDMDTVAAAFSVNLANYANVENVRLLGTAALNATGNNGSNTLIGNDGANVLDGKAGFDVMQGGKGNDTYHVDHMFDLVVEKAGEGTDTVIASVSHILQENVERLILAANAGDINGTGNALKNTLIGNSGENVLDGGKQADTMIGGAGNDSYTVDNVGDKVVEKANEGHDSILSSINFSLAALGNVEDLRLTGNAIRATGNALDNHLTGNDLYNIINGGAGADTMSGGLGGDTYYVDHIGDVVIENPEVGVHDKVVSTIALSKAFANVEDYDFRSLAGGVNFTGNDLDNAIWGGAGIDTLAGGVGDDVYYLNNAKDVVIEAAGNGYDSIVVNFTADLLNYANVDELRLTGTAAINAFGNADGNEIIGNAGDNIIDGRGGSDSMSGLKGNDTYYVDNANDSTWELADEGIDTVISSVTHVLKSNVENLKLAAGAGAINGTGNDLDNLIVGNQSANILTGGAGADTMKGGKGDDIYNVDNSGDKIIENANEGYDAVGSSVDYTLSANVEALALLGSAVKASGNALDNHIEGNDGNNIIDGGAGQDLMIGGKGNDTYYVDNAKDTVTELVGEGIDTIVSSIAFNNAIAEVENYDFSKLAGGMKFTGSASDNIIKGAAGIDTLSGLGGNDTYYVNSTKDKIVEAAGEGSDTVATGTFSIDLSKYAEVENAKLIGSLALNLKGTSIANVLTGNAGANTLDGKEGADTMIGGKGNDTYYVDDMADVVVEKAGGGVDTVISSIYHELAANVENLVLAAGAGSISGVGNDGKNTLVGNEGMNALVGGKGADVMKGGEGDDTYYVDNIGDKVIELANEGVDTVVSTIDFSLATLANVESLRLDGNAIKATGNALSNRLIGNDNGNILNGGAGADELWGGKGNDIYYFDSAGDSIFEDTGAGKDTVISFFAFANAISNVENYDFSKLAVSVSFTGNDLDNVIKGGSVRDKLTGGLGNDTYFVNSTKDLVVEAAGQGKDTVATSVFDIDLSKYANVENAALVGTNALKATGDGNDNFLMGNAAANVLDGKGGADTLQGGKGNDTYYIDSINDQVMEKGGQGYDTLFTTVNHTLNDNIEKMVLIGSAFAGVGNYLNNVLIGNNADNSLDGGEGADLMKGRKGNDTYAVDNAGDKVVELAGEGHDTIVALVDFSLASLANVEDLYLGDLAREGTGNALANLIVGNDAYNRIDGGKGADTMEGGKGSDDYYVDNLGDLVVENVGEGSDTVYSTVALTHGYANVELYDFQKVASSVNFTGTVDDNDIWGSAFADTLRGGKGDDGFYVTAGDKIVELSGEGNDTVYTTTSINKLWDNVESVYFDEIHSTVAWNATGNDLDNLIRGNAGANILNGGAGNDRLEGFGGNDILTGGEGSDVFVVEHAMVLSTNDIITDFDGTTDKLYFRDQGSDYSHFLAGIVDFGLGEDVVLHLVNGGKITLAGVGTGSIDSLTDLVADPSQIMTS